MKRIGLTGGIGSGKSTVAGFFKELGVPIYNSDEQAKRLMIEDTTLIQGIKDLIGTEAYQEGQLNRGFIAQRIFNDEALLQAMNDLVHPAVRQDFLNWAEKQESPYVIQETALIFENGMQDFYDATILVTAPIHIRIERVLARDKSNKVAIQQRMANQLPDTKKEMLADHIIVNLELEQTEKQVERLHQQLLSAK
ncbi:dephospho-CoA kinase [Sediminicola luteus]|uniref:Dephospho-CoA kinase n=1 Tax=Sediminicola luteus TaxID=319238 RepID=A0A2A4G6R4_9FLAO|nr:dephospho-CoA kinase [Sediminicola luteus]PCE63676.1 dephospho-CoA kinase [Sediminicola luteus]